MGEILKELEEHLIEVAEKMGSHIEKGDIDGKGDWEIQAVTIISGRERGTDNRFQSVTNTKGLSVSELIGSLEIAKVGIINKATTSDE